MVTSLSTVSRDFPTSRLSFHTLSPMQTRLSGRWASWPRRARQTGTSRTSSPSTCSAASGQREAQTGGSVLLLHAWPNGVAGWVRQPSTVLHDFVVVRGLPAIKSAALLGFCCTLLLCKIEERSASPDGKGSVENRGSVHSKRSRARGSGR